VVRDVLLLHLLSRDDGHGCSAGAGTFDSSFVIGQKKRRRRHRSQMRETKARNAAVEIASPPLAT